MKNGLALISSPQNSSNDNNFDKGRKPMPERVIKLIALLKASSLAQLAVPPGLATLFSLMFGVQDWSVEVKILLGIGVLLITIIGTLFTNWVKLKLGSKQLDVTQSANTNDAALKLLEKMNEVIKTELIERDNWWVKRLDVVREQHKEELVELRKDLEAKALSRENFWIDKEAKVREEKHEVSGRCSVVSIKYGVLKNLLEHRLHRVIENDTNIDVIWNDDSKKEVM